MKKHSTYRTYTAIPLMLVSLVLAGCSSINKLNDTAQLGIETVDKGIDQINNDSTKWQSVLQEVADKLPKDVQSTVREEMTRLVDHSIAKSGEEFRCETDFLGGRAVLGLKRVKALLLNQKLDPISPGFCHVTPATLNMNLASERRMTVEVSGFDMDQKDADGKPVEAFLESDNNERIPLPESKIGRTTHYHLELNLSDDDLEKMIFDKKISKIKLSWNGKTEGFPEIVVVRKKQQQKTFGQVVGQITHVPTHTQGDGDFDTDDDEPMSVTVKGQTDIVDQTTLKIRVYMRAREERSDWTTADSWSDWQTAYRCPDGWRIKSVSPIGETSSSISINDQSRRIITLSQGEVVNRFEIRGDHNGDEAGSYTQVKAYFSPVTITIEEKFSP